jgi:hypothetical protein
LEHLKWRFYFIFVAWNTLVTFPTIFFMFKETKQKSLEEIDLFFGGPVTIPVQSNTTDTLDSPTAVTKSEITHKE